MKYVGEIPASLIVNGRAICHTDRLAAPKTQQVGNREWEILFPFASRVHELATLALPGMVIDFLSVPRFAWAFQSPMTGKAPVAVDHDGGYGCKYPDRSLWDDRFGALLRHYGETVVRTEVMYQAVRLCGWVPYRRRSERVEEYRDRFLLFDLRDPAQCENLKLQIARHSMIGELMIRQRTDPGKADFYEQEIRSIARGDIDEILTR